MLPRVVHVFVFPGGSLLTVSEISNKVRELKADNAERDIRNKDILAVRSGHVQDQFPEMFNDAFPKPIIANFIDIAARDTAEMLAPLPTFNCSAANMVSDAARKFADKRTKGAHYYIQHSRLGSQMYVGADYYVSYGLMPILVEPDFAAKTPRYVIESPLGAYPEWDRWRRLVSWTRCIRKPIRELCVEYPEYADRIAGKMESYNSNTLLELVLYRDEDQTVLVIPERHDLVLAAAEQRMSRLPVRVAERPSLDRTGRGQFDDVLWVQLARHRMALLGLEAAEESVEAPLALPLDVQEVNIGPHSTLRSASPEKIRRVPVEMPQGAFVEPQLLDQELRVGARYPQARTGNIQSSIITGAAVQELQGGFDSQIKAAQDIFVDTFKEVVSLGFEMDELYWPNTERNIRGNQQGVPYEIKWKPSRDVNGDRTVDVTYGFAAGLDPNRALVFLLQLLGGDLVSKDMVRRQFPFDVNVTQEEQRIEIEHLREALLSSVGAISQAIPALTAQGQDPTQFVTAISDVIAARQRGTPIEDAVSKAFAPKQPPEGSTPGAAQSPGGPGAASPSGGSQPPGAPPGAPQGPLQQQLGTQGGGRPQDLMTLLAGIGNSGSPTTNVNMKRSIPAK